MKTMILAILISFLLSTLHAADRPPWWLVDNSDSAAARMGNVRHACRIEMSEGIVKLLAEQAGKLVSFFESKNPVTIDQAKQQIRMASSVCVPVGADAYVMIDSVSSIQIERRNGAEVYVLRGIEAELGTVADAAVIKRIKTYMDAQ
jgi:hypothetical protein